MSRLGSTHPVPRCAAVRVFPTGAAVPQRHGNPVPLLEHHASSRADASTISFVDVEWGWAGHEALPPVERVFGVPHGWWWHGNAVLGVIVGRNTRAPGLAPGVRAMVASPWTIDGGYSPARALVASFARVRAGDVLLLELQTTRDGASGLPAVIEPGVADAIARGRRAGVLTIAAAGNGGHDLDALALPGPPLGRSGAILVGAAGRTASGAWARLPESCHGAAVGFCARGEEVATAWSNHIGTARDAYNPSFSGTSAAAALVAGLVLAAQSLARRRGHTILPAEMQERLVASGTRVPGIGVMPVRERLLAQLRVDLVPVAR
jgi:hypothetical protein